MSRRMVKGTLVSLDEVWRRLTVDTEEGKIVTNAVRWYGGHPEVGGAVVVVLGAGGAVKRLLPDDDRFEARMEYLDMEAELIRQQFESGEALESAARESAKSPSDIDAFLKCVGDVWRAAPELRFGQLLVNTLSLYEEGTAQDLLFYVEDDRFLAALTAFREGLRGDE